MPSPSLTHLWYELKYSVGEECPDGQADEVGQHFGEIRFLGEGYQQKAEQRREVDHGDGQKPVTPDCQDRKDKQRLFFHH